MFGLFLVKEGQKIHTHYGAMSTYLCSCAVHIETTNSITDNFIQALRRLTNRIKIIRIIQNNNGSNFGGANNELKRTFSEMDKIRSMTS